MGAGLPPISLSSHIKPSFTLNTLPYGTCLPSSQYHQIFALPKNPSQRWWELAVVPLGFCRCSDYGLGFMGVHVDARGVCLGICTVGINDGNKQV
jgi:hypothetical protein